MQLMNFIKPLLRSGGVSCDISNVVAIAGHCREEANSQGECSVYSNDYIEEYQQQKGS